MSKNRLTYCVSETPVMKFWLCALDDCRTSVIFEAFTDHPIGANNGTSSLTERCWLEDAVLVPFPTSRAKVAGGEMITETALLNFVWARRQG